MANIKLTVSYEGTAYYGFQDQGPGKPTIQAALEQAVAKLTGERLRVCGAGRTDAGVHAAGQVVNVHTTAGIPIEKWPFALNSVLPRDIVVIAAEEAPPEFHARYSAIGKVYRYTIDNGVFADVFMRRYAYHVRGQLDLEAMSAAAALLVGTHDFAAFRSLGSSSKSTTRTITQLTVEARRRFVQIDIAADGFLYNMARIIVGTLLNVGKGQRPISSVADALQTGQRALAGPTAPPHGLCLMQVCYPTVIGNST